MTREAGWGFVLNASTLNFSAANAVPAWLAGRTRLIRGVLLQSGAKRLHECMQALRALHRLEACVPGLLVKNHAEQQPPKSRHANCFDDERVEAFSLCLAVMHSARKLLMSCQSQLLAWLYR
ncbi:hypothetical protein [Comamonas sp. lk]|uniref:hypothetical protein n=1 Tax=Comamonas sp. lk TaxID=2201272 RepID=UPI0013CE43BF|nr:hypothetical protein [Comamonas sp. lk]